MGSLTEKEVQIVQQTSNSKPDLKPAIQETNPITDPDVNVYIHAATSDNTRRAYRQDIKHFVLWGGMLPAAIDTVIKYLHEHATHLNARTLKRRITALKNWHVLQGFADPTNHPLVKKTLTGIEHVHGKPKEKARALTLEELAQMVNYLKVQNSLTAGRNMALLLIGFFGAFRRSELVSIKYEHISYVPEGMEILVPRSKADQSGEGQLCAIPYTNDDLCPVTSLKTWLKAAVIESGFVFPAIDRHYNFSANALSMQSVNLIIKKIALECQLNKREKLSSHSLRRGFATTASRKGAPFISIMRHGRWRHEGTVLGYIEEGQRFVENAVKWITADEKK